MEGDEEEDDVDDLENEFNYTRGGRDDMQQRAEAMMQWQMHGKGRILILLPLQDNILGLNFLFSQTINWYSLVHLFNDLGILSRYLCFYLIIWYLYSNIARFYGVFGYICSKTLVLCGIFSPPLFFS